MASTPSDATAPVAPAETSSNSTSSIAPAAADTTASQHPTTKREKKPKAPKPAPAPAVEKPLSPSLIDLRVGHILKAEYHPNADSLFVSTIAVGDAPGTPNTQEYTPPDSEGAAPVTVRTVCSGLNGLIPLEEMQGRYVVCVCNLKPITMRGVKSAAMVLAASPRTAAPEGGEAADGAEPKKKETVELVSVPEGSVAGERVAFEDWEGEPEAVLNPKKKVWEMCQVGFLTTDARQVGFDAGAVQELSDEAKAKGVALLKTSKGVCTVKSLTGATVR